MTVPIARFDEQMRSGPAEPKNAPTCLCGCDQDVYEGDPIWDTDEGPVLREDDKHEAHLTAYLRQLNIIRSTAGVE